MMNLNVHNAILWSAFIIAVLAFHVACAALGMALACRHQHQLLQNQKESTEMSVPEANNVGNRVNLNTATKRLWQ